MLLFVSVANNHPLVQLGSFLFPGSTIHFQDNLRKLFKFFEYALIIYLRKIYYCKKSG